MTYQNMTVKDAKRCMILHILDKKFDEYIHQGIDELQADIMADEYVCEHFDITPLELSDILEGY